jgi:hypothetical protein
MPDAAPIAPPPGTSRPGSHCWIERIVLAIAVVIAFGAVVPDFYLAADDLMATGLMHEIALKHPKVIDRIGAVVFSDEGQGHFRPTQDFLYVLTYAAFGPERWIFPLMALYALCHFASGCLLISILRRLGATRAVAFVAALIFVLHPVWDENLVSVQFGNNVPGLAALLAAALLWLPKPGLPGREAPRLATAAVFLFLAIGLGVNLMVSGTLLLGLMTLWVARQRRSILTLVVRGLVIAAPLGLGLLHRKLAYGALSTKHPIYQNLPRNWWSLGQLLMEVPNSAFMLGPSPMVPWTAGMNPPGLTWDDGARPLLSWDGVVVLATAVALGLFVLFLRKRDTRDAAAAAAQPLAPSFWFGLALTFAMLFPYYAFVGRAGPHRYLYPAIAGLAVMVSTAGAAVARKLATRLPERLVTATAAALLAFVLASLVRVDREAARSIASAHRVVREVTHGVAADLRRHPGLDRIFVLGYPRMIGRAGHTIVFPSHLLAVLNATVGTSFGAEDLEYQTAINTRVVTTPLPPNVAVYLVEADGVTVRRLSDSPEKELPGYARAEGYSAQARSWGLGDEREAMAALLSMDPAVVDTAVHLLTTVEHLERKHVLRAAFLYSRGSPLLAQAGFALADREPDGLQYAAQIATLTVHPETEKAAFAFLAKAGPDFQEAGARRAVELERQAWDIARRGEGKAENLKAFQDAQAAWKAVGVQRDDLYDSISFSKLLDLDDAGLVATQQDWASRGWSRLANAAAGFRKSLNSQSLEGFSIELIPRGKLISGSGSPIALEAMIHNRSDVYVPGAVSAISARLVWTLVSDDGAMTPAGDQWLPPEGIGAHGDKNVMASLAPVSAPNVTALRVDLIAHRKTCATATWNVPRAVASASHAGSK